MSLVVVVLSAFAGLWAAVNAAGSCDAAIAGSRDAATDERPSLGASMLQRESGTDKVGTSLSDLDGQEQLQHEARRQSAIVDGLVERRLLALATMVKEGLAPGDATALCHSFASKFDPTSVDFSAGTLPANMHEAIQGITGPLGDMFCQIRKEDCKSEFHNFLHKILAGLMSSATALFQKSPTAPGAPEPELLHQGEVDPVLLELYEKSFIASMRGIVKQGESAASAVQQATDVLAKMKNTWCVSALPTYLQMGKTRLAHTYFSSMIKTVCLPTTKSCETLLTKLLGEVATQAEAEPGSLVQMGMRAAVKAAMKLYGVPDFPEESVEERAAANKAYLDIRAAAAAAAARSA